MPKLPIDKVGKTWTYGAEHELADWDTSKGWDGFDRDPEPNICNSNGIAADPRLISYQYGGEINTPPTSSIEEQGELLSKFLRQHPDAKANWRCGLHIHIQVPGLKDSLPDLKRLALYILENTEVYDLVDPLPRENEVQHPTVEERKEARKRYNWMRMSHFTAIPRYRVERQLKANSTEEFFRLEVPESRDGKALWHAQPRASINLRQLLQTNTIEFRHYPATLSAEEVITAAEWCRDYLVSAFDGERAITLFNDWYKDRKFPTLDTIYVGWQEARWRATTITKNPRRTIEENIRRFLEEDKKNARP